MLLLPLLIILPNGTISPSPGCPKGRLLLRKGCCGHSSGTSCLCQGNTGPLSTRHKNTEQLMASGPENFCFSEQTFWTLAIAHWCYTWLQNSHTPALFSRPSDLTSSLHFSIHKEPPKHRRDELPGTIRYFICRWQNDHCAWNSLYNKSCHD